MATRRSQSDWQQLIDEHASSGLTQKAYCRQQGIALATFGYWKRKLKPESSLYGIGSESPEVRVNDWVELSDPRPGGETSWKIELDLGHGVCLRLTQTG